MAPVGFPKCSGFKKNNKYCFSKRGSWTYLEYSPTPSIARRFIETFPYLSPHNFFIPMSSWDTEAPCMHPSTAPTLMTKRICLSLCGFPQVTAYLWGSATLIFKEV